MVFGLFTGASKRAAKKRRNEINNAIRVQNEAFGDIRDLFSPTADRGERSNKILADLLGANGQEAQAFAFQQFQDSPGVQFLRDQGLGGIDRSAASRGQLFSGRTVADAGRFNQGVAEQSLQDRMNRLGFLGQQGVGATTGIANARQTLGNNVSNLTVGRGEAAAAGVIGAQNERVGLLNSALQLGGAFLGGAPSGGASGVLNGAGSLSNIFGGGGPSNISPANNTTDFRRIF